MKKIFSALLTVCMLLGCLSACGAKTARPMEEAQPPELRILSFFAQASDITSLDFHVGKNPATYDVTCNIFDSLVTWDADINVIPHLAESWEFLDEDSLQMHLAQGRTVS